MAGIPTTIGDFTNVYGQVPGESGRIGRNVDLYHNWPTGYVFQKFTSPFWAPRGTTFYALNWGARMAVDCTSESPISDFYYHSPNMRISNSTEKYRFYFRAYSTVIVTETRVFNYDRTGAFAFVIYITDTQFGGSVFEYQSLLNVLIRKFHVVFFPLVLAFYLTLFY